MVPVPQQIRQGHRTAARITAGSLTGDRCYYKMCVRGANNTLNCWRNSKQRNKTPGVRKTYGVGFGDDLREEVSRPLRQGEDRQPKESRRERHTQVTVRRGPRQSQRRTLSSADPFMKNRANVVSLGWGQERFQSDLIYNGDWKAPDSGVTG